MSQYGNYIPNQIKIKKEINLDGICKKCGSNLYRKYLLFFWMPKTCKNKECKIMTIDEINKMLKDKTISEKLRNDLLKRKKILESNENIFKGVK